MNKVTCKPLIKKSVFFLQIYWLLHHYAGAVEVEYVLFGKCLSKSVSTKLKGKATQIKIYWNPALTIISL